MNFSRLLHSCYYLIHLYSFYICFSLVLGEPVTFDNIHNDKDITISAEEILRRRMLVEQHLAKYKEKQKDWIETYHLSFSESDSNFITETMPKYSVLEEDSVNDISLSKKKTDSTFDAIPIKSTKNYNPNDQKNNLQSIKIVQHYSNGESLKMSSDRSSDINIRVPSHSLDKTEDSSRNNQNSEKITSERVLQLKNADLLLSDHTNDENDNSNLNDDNELYKQSDIKLAGLASKQILDSVESDREDTYSDHLDNFVSEETEIPDSAIKFKSDSDKIVTPNKIQVPVIEEFSKNFVNHPENSLYYKNDILRADFIQPNDLKSQTISNPQIENSNQPNDADSLSESVRPKKNLKMLESEGFFPETDNEKCQSGLSSFKNIISSYTVLPYCEMTEVVKLKAATNHLNSENYIFSHSIERIMQNGEVSVVDKKGNRGKDQQFSNHHRSKEISEYTLSTSKGEKNIPSDFNENDYTLLEETSPSLSDELLKRKRLIKPFISSLNEKNVKWKETYDFSNEGLDSGEVLKSFKDLHRTGNKLNSDPWSHTSSFFKASHSVERYYVIHWLKRLYNKFVYYHDIEEIKITLSFSSNILKDLEELISSETFDVTQADEFLSGLIKNATIIQNYDDDFSFVYTSVGFYMTSSIILLVLIYSLLLHFPITRIIFPIIGLLLWHGWKMYSEKLAGKHAVLSSTAPEYCQNILNVESGILAHFKEFFRSQVHDDQCQKYFKALMTDPLSELSVTIVVSDFISSTFFQFFIPMGRTLNTLAKDLFSGLGILSAFYLFILIIVIFGFLMIMIMIYHRYKFNFPFFLGSAEPTALHSGSRVEDLQIKQDAKEQYFLKSFVFNKYDVSPICHPKLSGSSDDKSLTFHHDKKSRALIRRLSI